MLMRRGLGRGAEAAGGTDAAGAGARTERRPQRGAAGAGRGRAAWRLRRPPERRGQRRAARGSGRGSSLPWGTCCPRTWTTPGASTSQVSPAPCSALGVQRGAPGPRPQPGRPAAREPGLGGNQAPGEAGVAGHQVPRPSLLPPRLGAPSCPLMSSPFPRPREVEPPPPPLEPLRSRSLRIPPAHYPDGAMAHSASVS